MDKLSPKILVIGEAKDESDNICYYEGYNTITQMSTKDILFNSGNNRVDIYTSNIDYKLSFDCNNKNLSQIGNCYYKGSIIIGE